RVAARARCGTGSSCSIATRGGSRCRLRGGWGLPWLPPWAHRTGYGDRWRRALAVEAIGERAEPGRAGRVIRVAGAWRTTRAGRTDVAGAAGGRGGGRGVPH